MEKNNSVSRSTRILAAFSLVLVSAAAHGEEAKTDSPVRLNPPATGRIPVAFVLAPGSEVVDFAGPWGVFEYVNVPGRDQSPFQLYTVAETTSPLQVSGGMRVVPDYTFQNAPPPKIVVVPAQGEPTEAELSWLRQVAASTDITLSVCNGAFVLAKAGLLAGKPATAHHGAYTLLAADFPDIKVQRGARFVDAGNISTSGGLTSGIDLALHVVERYFGRTVAEKSATALEYQGQGWKDARSNRAFAARPVSTAAHPRCPVCDHEIDKTVGVQGEYKGRKVWFCGDWCKHRFEKTPERFAIQ